MSLAVEYEADAKRLGVQERADHVTAVILDAVRPVPFPEEAVVTQDDVVGGLFRHLTGTRAAKVQILDRFEKLTARYESWWDTYGPPISGALNEFQSALIAAI